MLLLFLTACLVGADTDLVASSRPIDGPITATGERKTAQACVTWVFWLIPMTHERQQGKVPPKPKEVTQTLLDELTANGAHPIVDVSIDERTFTHLLGTTRCLRISGRQVE